MTARLILHIGANKTGSSAIQTFLRLNHKALGAMGILVPDRELGTTSRVTGEHVFAFQELISKSNRAEIDSRLRALAQNDAGTVICSAENLSNGANFQHFAKSLSGLDCKVVLYIRRQDELLTSTWQQWNSKNETDLNAWLLLALQRLGHWHRCIDGWENVAGQGNVIVRVFQRADLVNGDVVDDFIDCCGLKDPAGGFKRSTGTVNPSYSDLITPVVSGSKFIFNGAHDNDFYGMVGDLTGDFYISLKRISLITPAQRDKIIEFYRLHNESVCRRYFPGRPRLFESVDHSKYDYLSADELARRQLQFVTELVFSLYKRIVKGA